MANGKYLIESGRILPSSVAGDLSPGSWLIATLIARAYQWAIPKYCRGQLLDLGCGRAPLFGVYSRYVENAVLLDWRLDLGDSGRTAVVADLRRPLPLADESFDTILLSDVLEHLPCPAQVWAEMHRLLRQDGVVLLNVPFIYWVHEAPHDYFRYTEYALRHLANDAHFEVELLAPVGGDAAAFADFIAKQLVRLPVLGATIALIFQRLVSWMLPNRFEEPVRENCQSRFPIGYFLVARKRKGSGNQYQQNRTT